MTAAILTTIRQQLRKPWVRALACMGVMLVGYVVSAGHIIGLAFHPIGNSTVGSDQRLRSAVLSFYEPLFAVVGSDYCPKAIPRFISFCMGTQRYAVAIDLNETARQALRANSHGRALSLAKFTDKLGVKYDIFDDRPDLIIADIERQIPREYMPRRSSTVVHWSEMTCADWGLMDRQILATQGVTYEIPEDTYCSSSQFIDDDEALNEVAANAPTRTCGLEESVTESLDTTENLVIRPNGPAVHLARAEGPGTATDPSLRPEGPAVPTVADAHNSNERPALQASGLMIEDNNPARWAGLSERLAPWAARQCFEDRPDLILADLNSDRSAIEMALRPFKVGVIDIRDEQDRSNSSPDSPDQTSLYTLRVASPELLLDQSQIVQLQGPIETSAEDAMNRILPVLAHRIVCQQQFPAPDYRSKLFSFSLGFNR